MIVKGATGGQRHYGLCLSRRPYTSRRWVQGRSQCRTLRAPDLHNARVTNPFYNMGYKMIMKIRQKRTFHGIISLPIGAMHSPQPLSTSAMASQSHWTPWRRNCNIKKLTVSAREWDRTSFETDGHSNKTLFRHVQGDVWKQCLCEG